MADKCKKAKTQIKFCKDLMDRLVTLFEESTDGDCSWWAIPNHTQISNDIVRLRRELNALNKLMNPYDNGR